MSDYQGPGIPCFLPPQIWDYKYIWPSFLQESWVLSLGPHTFKASTLLTELPPQHSSFVWIVLLWVHTQENQQYLTVEASCHSAMINNGANGKTHFPLIFWKPWEKV